MKLLSVQFSSAACHFMSLWSRYSVQHPVLKHPESMKNVIWHETPCGFCKNHHFRGTYHLHLQAENNQ
jgi:hypothetical protein